MAKWKRYLLYTAALLCYGWVAAEGYHQESFLVMLSVGLVATAFIGFWTLYFAFKFLKVFLGALGFIAVLLEAYSELPEGDEQSPREEI